MLFASQRSTQATDEATSPPADIKAHIVAVEQAEAAWTEALAKVNLIFMEALL